MAAVVQDGKMSAPTQGGLFQGTIFWLSLKVPQRPHIAELIKSNGGFLVTNEKDADVCIVDHLKKDNPEGMFSYEYITKSVEARELESLEKHRAVTKSGSTASGPPRRLRGHNPFSKEDDDILLETLSKPGIKLFGNAIYKKLAEQYPQHTMHSWRGRWVDNFSKIMPNGPIPPKKQSTERKKADQNKEKDVEVKREEGQFTKEDEDLLEKQAGRIMANPDQTYIYDILSKNQPQHTSDQWRAHFENVILPKMNRGKIPGKPAAKPNQPTAEPKGPYRQFNNQESVASSSRGPPSQAKQEVKIKSEPTTSSPGLEHRKGSLALKTQSPIRTVDVRTRPNGAPSSTSKDKTKPSTSRQRRKTTSSSPSHRPTTPTGRAASIASSVISLPTTTPSRIKVQPSENHTPRWRAEIHRTPTIENKDNPVLSLSPPKPLSHLLPSNQKRKRDLGLTPELRNKSKNIHGNASKEPGSESLRQSRLLSPELLGSEVHHLTSSPPLPTPKKKLKYAELSTQAIYDQLDDPSLEFPEIGLPSTPPPPLAQYNPRLQTQQKPPTPIQPFTPTLVFPDRSPPPLSPTRSDPDGIQEMNSFLAYCHRKFNAPEKQVIYAIERASGIKQLVELVLQSIVDDNPLPTHVPGVWSEGDDKVLMGADSREMKKLQERKGAAHMERRMEFLNLWNMA